MSTQLLLLVLCIYLETTTFLSLDNTSNLDFYPDYKHFWKVINITQKQRYILSNDVSEASSINVYVLQQVGRPCKNFFQSPKVFLLETEELRNHVSWENNFSPTLFFAHVKYRLDYKTVNFLSKTRENSDRNPKKL